MASSTKYIYNMERTSTNNLHVQGRGEGRPLPEHPPLSPSKTSLQLVFNVRLGPEQNATELCFSRVPPRVKWVWPTPSPTPSFSLSLSLSPPVSKTTSQTLSSSNHEGILILQLFKFFNLLSQKQYPLLAQCGLNLTHSHQ